MSKSKALRPCPFCGSTPTLERHPGIVGIVCGNECDQQGLAIAFHPDKEAQAIAHWNRAADRLAALEESHTLLSASLKKQDAQIERLEQDNARLRGLLGAARCPHCDGSGAIPHGPTPDGDWEAEQCQWCYEKQEALAAGGDQ